MVGWPGGLQLAIDLGWRGIPCLVLEQETGPPHGPSPRRGISPRTMEFCRRWGIRKMCAMGISPRFRHGHRLLYVAARSLDRPSGIRVARRPAGGPVQPGEQISLSANDVRPCACPRRAPLFHVDLRHRHRLESFADHGGHVSAIARDLDRDEEIEVRANYLIACDGSGSPMRDSSASFTTAIRRLAIQ